MQSTRTSGFTLVEILVVAPLVILIVAGFIGVIVTLTGESLQASEQSKLAHDTQDTLDDIETVINQASAFATTTGALASPQGKNNDTQAFTTAAPTGSETETLIVRSPATTTNPLAAARELVYTGASPCDTNQPLYQYSTIYFTKIENSVRSLFKRTVLDTGTTCRTPWQRPSCSSDQVSANTSVCKTRDEKLLNDVTSFTVDYYGNASSSSVISDGSANTARSALVTVSAVRSSAGSPVTYSASMRATSVNNVTNP